MKPSMDASSGIEDPSQGLYPVKLHLEASNGQSKEELSKQYVECNGIYMFEALKAIILHCSFNARI